ncbi:3,4-dihydroxy-2-butanone-4-phosphate synthase [Kocuria indica]|uniref:Riboflavin synthase n=1 Tax=Kocuria marina subsp. indica TaxID=1049583 RepID=A0A6N9QY01_9MICC|nr:3,4-dihydroxy-2-butanone-4-phosphate synthase [Kocuria marina]NDO77537.1 3,4-dihydroxy-2-butanone-4-phosphate synthase [Kocuria indica]
MFTGIVEAQATVERVERLAQDAARLHVSAGPLVADLPHGGSLAVNGVCLTAVPSGAAGDFTADVMGETLRLTTLGALEHGDLVNVERCTAAGQRLDGHVVQGHVDGVGTVVQRTAHTGWETVRVSVPVALARYIAVKGSIAVDGVSLTVTAVNPADEPEAWFEVGLIPETLRATTLGARTPGSSVNLEVDVLAKYAERLASYAAPATPRGVALDPVADAVAAMASGAAVVVVDDEDRENEGDLVFAAQHATQPLMGFTIRHSSGVVCVPMTDERADRLALPPMTEHNEDAKATAYTVTCDARAGITTGISARDRALTTRLLALPGTTAAELTRPGHILPLRAVPGGVRERAGHTEAAVELARLAGCEPVGAIAEIVDDAGQPLRAPALRRFADEHGLVMISIADLIAHLDATDAAEDAVPRTAANDAASAAQDAKSTTRTSAVDVAGGATAPSVDTTGEGDRIA